MPNKKSNLTGLDTKEDVKDHDNPCCGISESGVIICPTCGNKINELTSLRCPRCFSSLIKQGGCSGNCAKCGTFRA